MSLVEAPETMVFARLTAATAINSVVGDRVYPILPPVGSELPLIVFQRTGVERPRSLTGNVGNPVVTLQLTTFGLSYTSVKSIARAVRLNIDNYTGTINNVTVSRTTLVGESDGVEMLDDQRMLPYFKVSQSFEFRINEAT